MTPKLSDQNESESLTSESEGDDPPSHIHQRGCCGEGQLLYIPGCHYH